MPGITLIFNRSGAQLDKDHIVRESMKKVSIHKDSTFGLVYSNEKLRVYLTGHDFYPVQITNDDRYFIIVEGKIYNYNQSQVETAIKNILVRTHDNKKINGIAASFFKDADGDFLVLAINKKSGKFFLINDALSRLPVYRYDTEKFSVITREIGIAVDLADADFDPFALAQFLITGYPWGGNTIYKNIKYLPQASIVSNSGESLRYYPYVDYNFENVDNVDLKEAARKAADLFMNSVSSRIKNHQGCILSLSGGLDSRAILAACKKNNIEIPSASYLDFEKESLMDVIIAEELASAFNSSLDLTELSPSPGRYFSELLSIKRGMNYLGMSFILGFFEHIRKRSSNYITGDGGDKLFPDIRPERRLKSNNALLEYILRHHAVFNLKTASAISGVKTKDIKEYLISHIDNYPEKSYDYKYVRFLNLERAGRWLFEGEDRNRYFFWNIAPFYSIHLFNHCSGINGEVKSGYAFFREFLHIIHPALNYVRNANWGFGLASSKLRNYLFMKKLKAHIPVIFKNSIKSIRPSENILNKKSEIPLIKVFLEQQVNTYSKEVNIDLKYLQKLKTLNKEQFYYLFTLLSLEEYHKKGQTSFSAYDFKDFEFFS